MIQVREPQVHPTQDDIVVMIGLLVDKLELATDPFEGRVKREWMVEGEEERVEGWEEGQDEEQVEGLT